MSFANMCHLPHAMCYTVNRVEVQQHLSLPHWQGFVFLGFSEGYWKRMLSPRTTECFWYFTSSRSGWSRR